MATFEPTPVSRSITSAEPPRRAGLGAILAGGQSRRFGSPKAHARVGGLAMIERVHHALSPVTREVLLVTSDASLAHLLGIPARADRFPDAGPLAGVETALHWAVEQGDDGVLIVACDLPLVSSSLLTRLTDVAELHAPLAVLPVRSESEQLEPLCAWYSARLLPEVQGRLRTGRVTMQALAEVPGVMRLPLGALSEQGGAAAFLNVNTPEELVLAERALRIRERDR